MNFLMAHPIFPETDQEYKEFARKFNEQYPKTPTTPEVVKAAAKVLEKEWA